LLSPGCEGFDAIFTSRGLARAVFLFEVGHPSSIERIDHHFDARTRSALRPPAPLARGFSVPQMLLRNGRRRARAPKPPPGRNRGGGGKANQFVCVDGAGVIPDSGYIRKEKMTSRAKIRIRSGKS
jgi:hypothetical protein